MEQIEKEWVVDDAEAATFLGQVMENTFASLLGN